MVAGVNLNDRNAWDDSALIDSWDEALAEYQKYYSIHAQGKRLEDVLTEEELKELREEHRDLIEEPETKSPSADANNYADHSVSESASRGKAGQAAAQTEERSTSEHYNQPSTAATATMPQAILGTVQDENLQNLMMSWYYAGYYTGVCAGQQKRT